MNTRRRFLLDCSAVVTVVSLFPFPVVSAPLISSGQSLDDLSYSDFAAQVHTKFRVRLAPARSVEIKLLRVRLAPQTRLISSRRPSADADNEKFSLIFSGPKHASLEPVIHCFEHAELGRFELHLGQIGAGHDSEIRYEAVFNRPAQIASRKTLSQDNPLSHLKST
jgi:hypothetical protein